MLAFSAQQCACIFKYKRSVTVFVMLTILYNVKSVFEYSEQTCTKFKTATHAQLFKKYAIPLIVLTIIPVLSRSYRRQKFIVHIIACLALLILLQKFYVYVKHNSRLCDDMVLKSAEECPHGQLFKISGHTTAFYLLLVILFNILESSGTYIIDLNRRLGLFYKFLVCFLLYQFSVTSRCFHSTLEIIFGMVIPIPLEWALSKLIFRTA